MTDDETRRALLELTEEASAASERSDVAALDRLIADDFVGLFGENVRGKAEVIAFWTAPGEASSPSHQIDNAQVFAFGDGSTAVVVAEITDGWTVDGQRHTYVERVFDVWQRRGEKWVWIATHPAKVASSEQPLA